MERCQVSALRTAASLLAVAVALCGCAREKEDPEAAGVSRPGTPVVAVVNYPLEYLVRRLAGEAAEVLFPVPVDQDPAFWQPTDAEIGRYQQADLVLLNGAGYARWSRTATLIPSRAVNTSAGFADQYLASADAVTHSHGPGGAHEHGAVDFNTWLDPNLALRHAASVRASLLRLLPGEAEAIGERFAGLGRDLQALDTEWTQVSEVLGDRPLLASHPVYGYLARQYGWKLVSLHWEPDTLPPEAEWEKLAELLRRHPARIMLWEDEPLPETRLRMESLGLGVAVFHPCGNRPPAGDYVSAMKANAGRLRELVERQRGE